MAGEMIEHGPSRLITLTRDSRVRMAIEESDHSFNVHRRHHLRGESHRLNEVRPEPAAILARHFDIPRAHWLIMDEEGHRNDIPTALVTLAGEITTEITFLGASDPYLSQTTTETGTAMSEVRLVDPRNGLQTDVAIKTSTEMELGTTARVSESVLGHLWHVISDLPRMSRTSLKNPRILSQRTVFLHTRRRGDGHLDPRHVTVTRIFPGGTLMTRSMTSGATGPSYQSNLFASKRSLHIEMIHRQCPLRTAATGLMMTTRTQTTRSRMYRHGIRPTKIQKTLESLTRPVPPMQIRQRPGPNGRLSISSKRTAFSRRQSIFPSSHGVKNVHFRLRMSPLNSHR